MANLKKQNIPFTQVANEVLNDKSLSWKAKGLFAYLFSKPDGWQFSGDRISKDSSDGRKATHSGLKELEDKGYIYRQKLGNGRVIYDIKYQNPNAQNGYLDIDPNAQNGKVPKRQSAETGIISNKEEDSNTNKESNKDSNGQAVAELLHQFEEVNPAIKRMYGNKTQRSAAERLIKKFGFEGVVRAAQFAVKVLGVKFAPRITTPYELETNWAKLVAFAHENKPKNNILI
ncbi:MAG: DnaA [Podoviridae sp. ctviO18]|nr:MAG: DnaA [Podoviridae sp. ctviO18]